MPSIIKTKFTPAIEKSPSVIIPDNIKEISPNSNMSKFDYDLYKDEDNITLPLIRVKSVNMPNKGKKWKIFQDTKVVFTIESLKLSKEEREYLQTVAGFNFLLTQAKRGIKSFNAFRVALKNTLHPPVIVPPKRGRGRPRKDQKLNKT